MNIKFHGRQSTDEVIENLISILQLFQDRYGITGYKNMDLELILCDSEGQEVELIDASTSEVLGTFEIYKSGELRERFTAQNDRVLPDLKLVVDNTKT